MVARDEICMDNETTQFCVSWVSMHVLNEAIAMFVTSWNAHPIPGMLCCEFHNTLYFASRMQVKFFNIYMQPEEEEFLEGYQTVEWNVTTEPNAYLQHCFPLWIKLYKVMKAMGGDLPIHHILAMIHWMMSE